MQAEWDSLFAGDSARPAEDRPSDGAGKRISITDKMALHIGEHPYVQFDADLIARDLNLNRQTVATTLSRLVREGRIQKAGSNRYAALRPVNSVDIVAAERTPKPQEVAAIAGEARA